jgi:hypothetical protein
MLLRPTVPRSTSTELGNPRIPKEQGTTLALAANPLIWAPGPGVSSGSDQNQTMRSSEPQQ